MSELVRFPAEVIRARPIREKGGRKRGRVRRVSVEVRHLAVDKDGVQVVQTRSLVVGRRTLALRARTGDIGWMYAERVAAGGIGRLAFVNVRLDPDALPDAA